MIHGACMGDLTHLPCPKCSLPAREILNYEMGRNGTRVGWYCIPCKHFEDAKFRERILITTRETASDGSHNARL